MIYDTINEKNVNNCLGYPQKNHIINIVNILIKDTFKISYDTVSTIKITQDLSLNDIIHEIHQIILTYIIKNNNSNTYIDKLSIDQLEYILSKLKDIEYNQSTNVTENIQLGALVGIFKRIMPKK